MLIRAYHVSVFLLLFLQVQAQECPIKNSVINGTKREYILGGHSWHAPLAEYLTDVVGQEFDPPITFSHKFYSYWLDAPTVEEALSLGYNFISSNAYRNSCYETEGKAISLAAERRSIIDPKTRQTADITHFGVALYTLSNRTDILTVSDVRGKKIGTNQYSNLAT